MSLSQLLKRRHDNTWHEEAEAFFRSYITNRFGISGLKAVGLRCPKFTGEDGVAFGAVLHKDSPTSGGYGGTSFVVFPNSEGPALVALGIGTQGLSPDELILTRPGHGRLCRAYAAWLRSNTSLSSTWAKSDPTRIDVSIPQNVASRFALHSKAIKRYGDVLYLAFDASESSTDSELEDAFVALFDFYMHERGIEPLSANRADAQHRRSKYEKALFKNPSEDELFNLLEQRRFVIVQGPPGTGKTRLALQILKKRFSSHGSSIQFHPAIGYEQFVGGLAPTEKAGTFGFTPVQGALMRAAAQARAHPEKPFLLVIDEINRADLAKVLGEAIFLFEPGDVDRELELAHDFGAPWHSRLKLPKNLFVLGTMNSSDRSIAILDLAIRRRFAFVMIWPDEAALESSAPLSIEAFRQLRSLFTSQASDDQLELMPGHAYFIAESDSESKRRFATELIPLLQGYLRQGLIAGFSEDAQGYLQWLDAKTA